MNDFIQGNHEEKFVKKPLPVGISDYRRASTEYYYVDKTMMIKEFIDERPLVSLFTRPRRFGKTLNMDMLRTFFEKTEEDTSIYFKDKKILIIDDLTNSGETIEKLIQHLIKHGINNQNLFSMPLIANVDILSRLHIPQEYWKKVEISEYNVPWGKTEIK